MILKNTNNFSVSVKYGTYSMTMTAGQTLDVQDMVPKNLPEGIIVLEKINDEMIVEPNELGSKSEVESVDNSKLLLG